jgi:hypothetical protein
LTSQALQLRECADIEKDVLKLVKNFHVLRAQGARDTDRTAGAMTSRRACLNFYKIIFEEDT